MDVHDLRFSNVNILFALKYGFVPFSTIQTIKEIFYIQVSGLIWQSSVITKDYIQTGEKSSGIYA